MTQVVTPPAIVPRAASVRGYGSSLMIAETHITVVSDRYLTKLAQALGAKVERNYGINSTKLLEAQSGTLTGWAQIWSNAARDLPTSGGSAVFDVRPPTDPLIVLDHAVNDGGSYGNLTNFQAAFAATLEAACRIFRAGFAWRDTHGNFSYGSGWTAQATANNFGGTRHTHASGSSTVTFTTPSGFLGGDMCFYAVTRPDSNETWTCTAAIDGGATVTTVVSNALGIAGLRNLIPIPVPSVPSGSGHTVVLSFNPIGSAGMSFLGGTLKSQWPPVVMLLGQPTLPTMPPSSEPNLTQAVLDGLNASLAAAPAIFTDGNVHYVDMSALNTATHWYEDQLHFSPDGHAKVADLIFAAIKASGGLPTGYSAGPVCDFAGKPDWSGAPGTQVIYDTTTGKFWTPKTVTAGDWVDVAAATVAAHEADTTAVHGIADTSLLVYQADLALKAPLASPALTGNPTAPTPAQGDNDTSIATTSYVQTEVGLVVPKALVDAKGDLIVATADNTPDRLAVGTNGQVLTADSTQATGTKWATPTDHSQLARTARGLISETGQLDVHTNAATLTSQKIYCRLLGLAAGDIVTYLCAAVSIAGAGTAPTTIKLALLNTSGVIKAITANLASDTGWTASIGPKEFAASTPWTVDTSGAYYVAFLQDGAFASTALQLVRQNSTAGADLAMTGGARSVASGGTGKTDISGTITFADMGAGSAFWFGVA